MLSVFLLVLVPPSCPILTCVSFFCPTLMIVLTLFHITCVHFYWCSSLQGPATVLQPTSYVWSMKKLLDPFLSSVFGDFFCACCLRRRGWLSPLSVSRMRVKLSQAMRLQDPQQLHWCERREEEETLQRLPARAVPVRPSSDHRRKCSGRPGRGERAWPMINARKLITYVESAGGKLERPPACIQPTGWHLDAVLN